MLGLSLCCSAGHAAARQAYRWGSVRIGAGGFVSGIAIHPTAKDLIYIRTDVGGAYRWDEANTRWIPVTDMFGPDEADLYGIESIALDPNNPDLVYMAAGMYRAHKGDVLKSTDRGRSWTRTHLNLAMGGNEDQRWAGERLAVDPNDSNTIYFASRDDGLWKSADAAGTWQRVTSFPTSGDAGKGLSFVVFDPESGRPRSASKTIYVGALGAGVYRSRVAPRDCRGASRCRTCYSPA